MPLDRFREVVAAIGAVDLDDAVSYLCWKGNQDKDAIEAMTTHEIVAFQNRIATWVHRENEANRGDRR